MYEYDFFISYSRQRYLQDARTVTSILRDRNYKVWLDSDVIADRELDIHQLIRWLAEAVVLCKHMIFFDLHSVRVRVGVLAYGGYVAIDTLFSEATFWQQFERETAVKAKELNIHIIDITPQTSTFQLGLKREDRDRRGYQEYYDGSDQSLR